MRLTPNPVIDDEDPPELLKVPEIESALIKLKLPIESFKKSLSKFMISQESVFRFLVTAPDPLPITSTPPVPVSEKLKISCPSDGWQMVARTIIVKSRIGSLFIS